MPSDNREFSADPGCDAAPSPELADCLDRLAAGDLAARDRIIELCGHRLRVLARRMLAEFPSVRRWDDTDDVFQNVAMRLHRALGHVTISSPRELAALAATAIHRELLDLARRHAGPMSFAANHATNLPGMSGPHAPPTPHAVREAVAAEDSLDRWTLFQDAIAELPDDLREVFHLVWYLDANQQAVAKLTACSERTVRRRWQEARQAVRTALDGQRPT